MILDRATLNDLRTFVAANIADFDQMPATVAKLYGCSDRRCCEFRHMLDCAELISQHETSGGQAIGFCYPFSNVGVMAVVLDPNPELTMKPDRLRMVTLDGDLLGKPLNVQLNDMVSISRARTSWDAFQSWRNDKCTAARIEGTAQRVPA